jgi:hypothetical protein
VHFPAGAVKKDGPSAGLAVTCALVSLLSGRLARSDTAMTGEVTLRGHVLAVGGVRAKVATAYHTYKYNYPNYDTASTPPPVTLVTMTRALPCLPCPPSLPGHRRAPCRGDARAAACRQRKGSGRAA